LRAQHAVVDDPNSGQRGGGWHASVRSATAVRLGALRPCASPRWRSACCGTTLTGGGREQPAPGRKGAEFPIRGPANLAGAWSAQPVPASPPRASHTPACRSLAARLPATGRAGSVGRSRVPRARRRGAPAATPQPRQQPLGRARTRAAGRGEGCRRSGNFTGFEGAGR
jgi:hypothetical protein